MKRFHELIAQLNSAHKRHLARGGVGGSGVPYYVPVTAQELLNAINNEPEILREILEQEALDAVDNPLDFVGESTSATEMATLGNDYNLLPSEIKLGTLDFRNVKKYLRGTKAFSNLTPTQQELIRTLQYDDAKFFEVGDRGGYKFKEDGVRFSNLREQLIGRLDLFDVMNAEMVAKFIENVMISHIPCRLHKIK